jgi:hypothetical protein
MGFELSAHRVERIVESLCSEVACGFPYLDSQAQLAELAALWHRKVTQIEDEVLERRRQERKGEDPP